MARYNPVFAPWIATIRSPTGIKLNCAELENKAGEIGRDKEGEGGKKRESERIVKSNYNTVDSVCFSLFIVLGRMAAPSLMCATSHLSQNAVTSSQSLCLFKHITKSPSLCFTLPLNVDDKGDALPHQMELRARPMKRG